MSSKNRACSTILFYQHGTVKKPRTHRLHQHEFWQLEIISSEYVLLTPDGERFLKKDDVLILPPRMAHGFRYQGKGESYITFKFHFDFASPSSPVVVPPSRFRSRWIACIRSLLEIEQTHRINESLAALLDNLLYQALPSSPASTKEPAIIRRARSYIQSNAGRSVTVKELSTDLGMSREYLSTLFCKTTGQTLKACIDQHRMHLAKEMLKYADLSVSEIAEQLGFPDIFTFSRFFKRNQGQNPLTFRQKR